MFSQLFFKVLHFSPVLAVSFSNYLVLILGYIGFSSLFQQRFTKFIFALIWFFPPVPFIDLLRYPIGVQYSLFGFSIFIINQVNFKTRPNTVNYLFLVLLLGVICTTVWVSDFALVSLIILALFLYLDYYYHHRSIRLNKQIVLFLLTVVIVTAAFIGYAKSTVLSTTDNYLKLNDFKDVMVGMRLIISNINNLLLFKSLNWLLSIYSWLVLISISIILIFASQNTYSFRDKKWVFFFLADFFTVFGTLLMSKWVFLNEMGSWYFVAPYISLSMVLLLLIDEFSLKLKSQKVVISFLFIAALFGAITTPYALNFIRPKTLKSKISIRSEFLELGRIGVIGEFWNSYITACPDPAQIKSTPHDMSKVRNQNLVDEVFKQPKLYLIKDMWLNEFPDTIIQFGYFLKKEGKSFHIGDCDINQYVRIKREQTFSYDMLKYDHAFEQHQSCLIISKENPLLTRDKFVVWGPYITLGIGKFSVDFFVHLYNAFPDLPLIQIEVTTDYGKKVLAQKVITSNELCNDSICGFNLEFETFKRVDKIEFRIKYFRNSDLCFEKIELKEI